MIPETPVGALKNVSPRILSRLHHLGIKTVRDLLLHLPFRYDDFSNIKKIRELRVGELATVYARLRDIKATRVWKRRMNLAEATVEDETGRVRVVWFNQSYLASSLHPGETLALSGKLAKSKKGSYLANPAYERIGKRDLTHTAGLAPVYPETSGLSSRWLRLLVRQALPLSSQMGDFLPTALLKKFKLPPLSLALPKIHFPKNLSEAEIARRRFSFEDIFLIQLRALRDRKKLHERAAPRIPLQLDIVKKFVASLPFPLTDAQRRAAWEIVNDMAKPTPMNRLLEGDVGSGKTVVAALAALNAMKAGYQVAYLAPTEILAFQHLETFKKLLSLFGVSLGLLTASQKRVLAPYGESSKANVATLAKERKIEIVIGTHAVIQDKVHLPNLGLIIVDEQHRFGVAQRAKLQKRQGTSDKRQVPHFLSMTATPIPRTLALTVFGDLDISVLDQLPKGRKPIVTKIVPHEKRMAAYEFIRKEIQSGRQAFVICPRIEIAASDMGQETKGAILSEEVKAVKIEYDRLKKEIFPDLRIGMMHGKLKAKEKERVMQDFKDRKLDVLISTSVVEVGVDVPNATVMLIDGVEKFGLAQIHQFRGRVGRSEHQSYCFLMTSSPLVGETARLKAVVEAKNGFELAEKDLAIRGPGDFFGVRQSGIPPFAYKSFSDMQLIQSARAAAAEIVEKDPLLAAHPELKKRLEEFEAAVHFE